MPVYPFTKINPDKGTETDIPSFFAVFAGETPFTKINPDKGTETIITLGDLDQLPPVCLQRLTPIRGRKLIVTVLLTKSTIPFTKINPDKGTETRR